jgi:hypothetical protein
MLWLAGCRLFLGLWHCGISSDHSGAMRMHWSLSSIVMDAHAAEMGTIINMTRVRTLHTNRAPGRAKFNLGRAQTVGGWWVPLPPLRRQQMC